MIRFLILAISTLCLTSIISNMNTYNFTKICQEHDANKTGVPPLSQFEQATLQSATAIGALASSIPLLFSFSRFSKKTVFLSAGSVSILATALIPLASELGYGFFLVARIFQGVAFSTTFPMIGAVTSNWAALSEHGIFLAFLTGNAQLSNVFTMPVSGALCSSSLGWHSVFYLHAGIAIVLFGLFALFFKDEPTSHRFVSSTELEKITQRPATKEKQVEEKQRAVPYKEILMSKTVWGVWLAAFADILAIQFVSMFNPQYMSDYLKFDVMESGFLAAVPVIVQWLCKIFAGVSSDMLTCFGETLKIRVYNSIALASSAVFFVVLSFIPPSYAAMAVAILIITEGLIGFNTAGFNKCGTLHARQYSHFVMIQVMNIQCLCILVEPFISDAILTTNTQSQWRTVFILHAVLPFICNIIFCLWADSRPAPWTQETVSFECEAPAVGKDSAPMTSITHATKI